MSGEQNTDRGLPSVNSSSAPPVPRVAVVAVLLAVLLGVGLLIFLNSGKKEEQADARKAINLNSGVESHKTFSLPPLEVKKEEPVAPPPPPPPPPLPILPEPVMMMAPPPPPLPPAPPVPELDKSGSALMATQSATLGGGSGDSLMGEIKPKEAEEGSLASMLISTRTQSGKTSTLGNRNLTMAKGVMIPCVLNTKLDSTVPGMTACVVTRNIYSDNGKVLLVERGSTVTGEYKSNMRQGMARIFVLWDRIKTPNGITVDLNSPGSDPLGGAGLPGYIDTHFWERFGGALMLSMIEVGGQVTTAVISKQTDGTSVNVGNPTQSSQQMATETLKNSLNIPPTLIKNQGEEIGIYVARDLDFAGVYDVVSTR